MITAEFTRSDETYGYRRLHAALARRGVAAGRELVRHLTRQLGLLPCQPRPSRLRLTSADAAAGPIPDLVGRDFTADAPGAQTRRGHHLHPDLGRVAVPGDGDRLLLQEGHRPRHRRPLPHVVDHRRDPGRRSDRTGRSSHLSHRPGSNYTSADFHTALTDLGLRHSVGRTGICDDNAMAESFFAALKNERVHRTVYPTRAHAIRDITRYIDSWYNTERLHSGLGYQTPSESHAGYRATA